MTEGSGEVFERAAAIVELVVRGREAGEEVDWRALVDGEHEVEEEVRALLRAEEVIGRGLPQAGEGKATREEVHPLDGRLAGERGDGRYRVVGEIGRGGMGVVWRVVDEELKRELAMKVIRREGGASAGTESRALRRFLDEAQITGRLNHPGIVPVYDVGCRKDGAAFYTMRLVEGEDLHAIFTKVRRGAEGWTETRAVRVILKVCEAMSYAHSMGVIHRDLKPANVMVGPFGEVYVMDWGLARSRSEPEVGDEGGREASKDWGAEKAAPFLLTMEGEAIGTPAYMAPEQAIGRRGSVGPSADIYSVGAMIYHLLAGQVPFVAAGETPTSKAILERLRRGPPPTLDRRGRGPSAALAAVCEKAMARDPNDRYRNMQALADDLQSYLDGRVVAAHEAGPWAEARAWLRRNKLPATALAGVLVLTAFVVGILTYSIRLRVDLADVDAVRATLQEFESFRGASNDPEEAGIEAGSTNAAERWMRRARGLIHGGVSAANAGTKALGVRDIRKLLSRLEARGTAPTAAEAAARRAEFKLSMELEALEAEALWRSRMLARTPWPNDEEAIRRVAAYGIEPTWEALNEFAWVRVRPDHPRIFGEEKEALIVARRLVQSSSTPLEHIRALDTRAFAELACGRLDEAVATIESAVAESDAALLEAFVLDNRSIVKALAERWRDGTEARATALLESEVSMLRHARGDESTRSFRDPGDRWWVDRLRELLDDLEWIGMLLEDAEAAYATEDVRRRWDDVTTAIRNSSLYGGLELPPQLHLLPLGTDPDSRLFEFVHLPSGRAPKRGTDRRIEPEMAMGIVFVLVPGDVATGRAPLFVSKYEVTQYQWRRLARRRTQEVTFLRETPHAKPITGVSVDDCDRRLRDAFGWIRLPTAKEWTFAALGGRSTPFWTGAEPQSLRGAEAVGFDYDQRGLDTTLSVGVARSKVDANLIIDRRPNPLGLWDVHGNVLEWTGEVNVEARPIGIKNRGRMLGYRSFGGSWNRPEELARVDEALSSELDLWPRHHRSDDIGFRPVRCVTR